MLSSAASGISTATFLYRQTPEYQAKSKAKELEIERSNLEKLQEGLSGATTDDKAYQDIYEETRDLDIAIARANPTKQNIERAREIAQERYEEEALKSQQKKVKTQRNQNSSFQERLEKLNELAQDKEHFSSKTRGQFLTAYHTALKKGDK